MGQGTFIYLKEPLISLLKLKQLQGAYVLFRAICKRLRDCGQSTVYILNSLSQQVLFE